MVGLQAESVSFFSTPGPILVNTNVYLQVRLDNPDFPSYEKNPSWRNSFNLNPEKLIIILKNRRKVSTFSDYLFT